jgi:hypothetical protein
MTRPQIIRAGTHRVAWYTIGHMLMWLDTIDLQDKSSPTAQDHSHQPHHPAPLGIGPAAPHQESALRQVDDERRSEESNLANGTWSDANTLREDPDSDDERTIVNGDHNLQQDEQAVRLNGGLGGNGDDGDMQDADAEEDLDDDMMDKISSSPSIDDGGYSLPLAPKTWSDWSSLTPSSAVSSPATCNDSSSPFTATPIHFPISATTARRRLGVPADGLENISKSSYRSSQFPFLSHTHLEPHKKTSADHHHGEYTRIPEPDIPDDSLGPTGFLEVSPRTGHMLKVEDRLQNFRQDSQMSLFSDLDEEDVRVMLQPMRSPIRDLEEEGPLKQGNISEAPTIIINNSDDIDGGEDSWTTDSEADSWDEEAEDDDTNEISFSDDPRFVDSGWGGECLRETEDIDFEFVYALHTFVATVEGQANASKGDTMVLLDDSNSYWWLVRVVKDSSIGKQTKP